jgi:hypothetical protein
LFVTLWLDSINVNLFSLSLLSAVKLPSVFAAKRFNDGFSEEVLRSHDGESDISTERSDESKRDFGDNVCAIDDDVVIDENTASTVSLGSGPSTESDAASNLEDALLVSVEADGNVSATGSAEDTCQSDTLREFIFESKSDEVVSGLFILVFCTLGALAESVTSDSGALHGLILMHSSFVL